MKQTGTPELHVFDPSDGMPNSRLPALVYRGALSDQGDLADRFEELFARHGWTGAWRDGIFDYHHFHSTAHEVLGVAEGTVALRLGGPGGLSFDLEPGDAVVIPAGVGHRNEGSSPSLLVVGATAEGRHWDICRGHEPDLAAKLDNIRRVPRPEQDPLHGPAGPLTGLW